MRERLNLFFQYKQTNYKIFLIIPTATATAHTLKHTCMMMRKIQKMNKTKQKRKSE